MESVCIAVRLESVPAPVAMDVKILIVILSIVERNEAMCQHQDGSLCRCKMNPFIEKVTNEDMVIESDYLFESKKMVQIRHDRELYRLQITSNGKLILTK